MCKGGNDAEKRFETADTLFECVALAAGNTTVQEVVSISCTGDGSISGTTITVKGGLMSSKSTTVTITNNATTPTSVSFDYSFNGGNSYQKDGANCSNSGSVTGLMPTKSVTLKTTAGAWGTAKIILSNFVLTEVGDSSTVKVTFDSGTVTVGGEGVSNGESVTVDTTGENVVATATDIIAWVDANNKILSTTPSFTLQPSGDMEIIAIHDTAARFRVGDYLFKTLSEAIDFAVSNTNKTVVLANSGTLPAGNYTIPSGITLLIPFDEAHTVVTTNPPSSDPSTYTAPSPFRTLTMSAGANLTVNGAMSVAGSVYRYQTSGYNGLPMGKLGYVNMQEGSSITVNTGGKLYVIGYIYGSGSVEVKSSGTVYECFQIRDFRGGSATSSMKGKASTYELFPMMQYYVQNVQVPMKLNEGAIEKGIAAFTITLLGAKIVEVPFVGDGGMFSLSSGYVIKDYLEESDRLSLEAHGTVALNSFVFTLERVDINSAEYVLPINHNITIDAKTGSNLALNQDIGLLPGSEIIVREGATCTLGAGKKVIVYDKDNWGKYCGEANTEIKPLLYVAGRTIYSRTAANLTDASVKINGTVDVSAGAVYVTTGKANIYSDAAGELKVGAKGTATTAYQATQSGSSISYVDIPIIPAEFKNAADGTTVALENNTFVYTEGYWRCKETHSYGEGVVTTEPTCTAAGVKTFTCSVCKHSYTETVDAKGHSFGDNDLCVNGCGKPAYKVENSKTFILSKDSTNYKEFSLKVTDWQVLHYDNGDTYVGFRATLKGDILDDVTAVGFAINGDVSKPAPHEWVEEADDTYTYTCLLKTTENEHTVQGVIDFQNVRYTSLSAKIPAKNRTAYTMQVS